MSKTFFQGGRKIFLRPLFTGCLFGANCAPVPTLSSPDKAISAISVKSLLHKGKRWYSTADYCKNVRAAVVFGLYCPSSQNL